MYAMLTFYWRLLRVSFSSLIYMYRASSGSYKLNNSPHLSLSSLESSRVDYYRTTVWQVPHNRTKQGALKGRRRGTEQRCGKTPRKARLAAQPGREDGVTLYLWLSLPFSGCGFLLLKGKQGTRASSLLSWPVSLLRAEGTPNTRSPTLFCSRRTLKNYHLPLFHFEGTLPTENKSYNLRINEKSQTNIFSFIKE